MANQSDFDLQNSAKAIDWSIECVRAGMLLNGGAVVALLAFMSGEKQTAGFNPLLIRDGLSSFAWGAGAAFAASAFGYLAQSAFAEASGVTRRWLPMLLTAIGILLMVTSISLFVRGSLSTSLALFPDNAVQTQPTLSNTDAASQDADRQSPKGEQTAPTPKHGLPADPNVPNPANAGSKEVFSEAIPQQAARGSQPTTIKPALETYGGALGALMTGIAAGVVAVQIWFSNRHHRAVLEENYRRAWDEWNRTDGNLGRVAHRFDDLVSARIADLEESHPGLFERMSRLDTDEIKINQAHLIQIDLGSVPFLTSGASPAVANAFVKCVEITSYFNKVANDVAPDASPLLTVKIKLNHYSGRTLDRLLDIKLALAALASEAKATEPKVDGRERS